MPLQAEWQSIHITQVRTNPSFNNHFLPQNYDEKSNLSSLQSKGALSAAFPPTVLLTTCALNMAVASIVTSSISKQILNAERLQSLCAIQGRLHVCVSELHFRCCFPKVPNGGPCPMPGIGAICQSGNCVERFPFWKIFLWPPAALCKLELYLIAFFTGWPNDICGMSPWTNHNCSNFWHLYLWMYFSSLAPGNLRLRRQFPKLM